VTDYANSIAVGFIIETAVTLRDADEIEARLEENKVEFP
jgi:hypothetical protein